MKRSDSCYLSCGGTFSPAFTKNDYSILKCSQCGLYALETDENYDAFLKRYYGEGYFSGKDNKFGYADYLSEEEMIRRNARGYISSILKLKPTGNFLDVGCAAGFFMDEAAKEGYSVYGLDTSEYIVSLAKPELREKIQITPFHKAELPKDNFDVVIMFDLIEHLADPKADLQRLHSSVKEDGILVMGTGDVGALYAKLLGTHNHFFAPPHHLFYFSRATITEMLKQSGYEVIKIEAKGKWLTLPYVARVAKHFNFPPMERLLNSSLFQNIFGKLWIYLYFGDNMVVYARKVS